MILTVVMANCQPAAVTAIKTTSDAVARPTEISWLLRFPPKCLAVLLPPPRKEEAFAVQAWIHFGFG